MKRKSFGLIISIILLITAIVTVTTGIFAWMSEGSGEGNSIVFITGDVDLSSKVYYGNDENMDGVLEPSSADYNAIVSPSRGQRTQYLYTEAIKDATTVFSECSAGMSISYKIVIINDNKNYTNAKISISFSELQSYFFTGLSEFLASVDYTDTVNFPGSLTTSAERTALLGRNSSRIMFNLNGLNARKYVFSANDAESDFLSGYGTMTASSLPSEYALDGIADLDGLNLLTSVSTTELSYNLASLSNGEYFIYDLALAKGELVEIDFRLTCLQMREVFELYPNYAAANYTSACESAVSSYAEQNGLTLSSEQKSKIARNYIDEMVDSELSYLFGDNGDENKELKFSITKIHITGTQTA